MVFTIFYVFDFIPATTNLAFYFIKRMLSNTKKTPQQLEHQLFSLIWTTIEQLRWRRTWRARRRWCVRRHYTGLSCRDRRDSSPPWRSSPRTPSSSCQGSGFWSSPSPHGRRPWVRPWADRRRTTCEDTASPCCVVPTGSRTSSCWTGTCQQKWQLISHSYRLQCPLGPRPWADRRRTSCEDTASPCSVVPTGSRTSR